MDLIGRSTSEFVIPDRSFEGTSVMCAREAVSPESDAAEKCFQVVPPKQQPSNRLKPGRLKSFSTLKQIDNQDNDSNYEQ